MFWEPNLICPCRRRFSVVFSSHSMERHFNQLQKHFNSNCYPRQPSQPHSVSLARIAHATKRCKHWISESLKPWRSNTWSHVRCCVEKAREIMPDEDVDLAARHAMDAQTIVCNRYHSVILLEETWRPNATYPPSSFKTRQDKLLGQFRMEGSLKFVLPSCTVRCCH